MIDDQRNGMAHAFASALSNDGVQTYISNLRTTVAVHRWGEHELPLTISDGHAGETFLCSPKVGYIDYPLEELAHFPNPFVARLLRGVVNGVGFILLRCDIDRIVHINNWTLSTNLPVALDPALVRQQTDHLAASFSTHVLAMRSLTQRHNADLLSALSSAGWAILPSRQVYLVDDVQRDSFPRRDVKRDDALWQNGEFAYEELQGVTPADADRLIALYEMLYREKYSRLNPAYTPRFIDLTHRIGLLRYLVLRDDAGVIQAFGGMHHVGRHATMPLLGYNTALDQRRGLYRLAFHAGTLYAARHGLFFNMSSGATAFKRNRGATAELEYTAFYVRHLPAARRYPFAALRTVAQRIGGPVLQRFDL